MMARKTDDIKASLLTVHCLVLYDGLEVWFVLFSSQ